MPRDWFVSDYDSSIHLPRDSRRLTEFPGVGKVWRFKLAEDGFMGGLEIPEEVEAAVVSRGKRRWMNIGLRVCP